MIYLGEMRNGVIVFPNPVPIPDGARVEVALHPVPTPQQDPTLSLFERKKGIFGQAQGLPADASDRSHPPTKKTSHRSLLT